LLSNSKSSSCSLQLLKDQTKPQKNISLVQEEIYRNCEEKTDPRGILQTNRTKEIDHNCGEKNDPRGILQTNRTICRSSETTVAMRKRRNNKQQQQQQQETRSGCEL